MVRVHPTPMWQRAVILLCGTVVGVVVVLFLHWGRPILIPIALAVLLTFLLNPLVRVLQRRGLSRIFSVALAVSMTSTVLMCMGWAVTRQIVGVLAELPQNTANIKDKIRTLRQLGTGGLADQIGHMVDEISEEAHMPTSTTIVAEKGGPAAPEILSRNSSETVVLRAESTPWFGLTGYLNSAFEILGTLAFALVLLVFFLLGRDDLRDRIVLLAGKARLALTSKALEDVTDRISRYIAMVALLNGGFGVIMAAGLYVLQVPYALLWGFVAGTLRFIPYIGPWIGAIFPIVMSLAVTQGWWQPLAVFGFVMVLELTSNNVIEPLAFGHSTGVSPTALLISAAFWLFLWGPIGLVLSAPFAVCLVVLGKNLPQLGFLSLLLGDSPAFRSHVGLYQRLILGDQMEAVRLVTQHVKDSPPDEVYDDILIPALNYAKRDRQRDYLSDENHHEVVEGMRGCLAQTEQIREIPAGEAPVVVNRLPSPPVTVQRSVKKLVRILGCPGTDETDLLGLEMLRQILNTGHWELEITSIETLTSELVSKVTEDPPAIICIASLPPGGLAHARYLCKRLREAAPEIQIIVGRWGQLRNTRLDRERLEHAGANFVATTLLETRRFLESRLVLLPNEEQSKLVPPDLQSATKPALSLSLSNA